MPSLQAVMAFVLFLIVSVENDNVADLIIDLQSHLHTGCVHLIGTDDEKRFLMKRLSSSWRQVGSLNIPTSFLFSCRKNRPLFVLLSADVHILRNLREVSGYPGVISSASWLLQLPDNASSQELLKEVYIPINCMFLIAYNNGSIMDVYRVGPDMPLIEQQWGDWTPKSGLLLSTEKTLLFRRQNLLGYSIRATSLHEPPLVFMDEQNLRMKKGGLFGDVWTILENVLNFSTRYGIPEERTWGTFYSADNTTGIVGMLAGAKVEVAVFNMLMTAQRLNIMDFSIALLSPMYRVFIMKPEGTSLDWYIYVAPFNTKLWCAVVGLILAISVYLPALHQMSRRHGIADTTEYRLYVQESLFVVFGAFCMQGMDAGLPQLTACRIVYLTVYLTAVVLLASYSATLVSFLTVHSVKLPFTSLEELLKDGSYTLGMLGRSTVLDYFQNPNESYYLIWKTLIEPEREKNLVQSTNQGLRRLCAEKYAFMTNFNDMVMNIDNTTCEMISLPQVYFKSSLSFGFAKNSSYRELFNYQLLSLRKKGILSKFKEDLYRPLRLKEDETVRESNKSWVSVSVGHLTPILLALLAGTLLGIAILWAERSMRGKLEKHTGYNELQRQGKHTSTSHV